MSVHKYKIVFVGDQSVGKTSIINRYTKDEFLLGNQPTVGIDFVSKSIQFDAKTVRLQLWDTAGQERFRSLIPSYIRDSHVIILVYDISNKQSFDNLEKWLNYIKEERESDVILFLVGNKHDSDQREVETQEGEHYKEQNKMINEFREISAKTNYQLPDMFKDITAMLLHQQTEVDHIYSIPIEKYNLKPQQQSVTNKTSFIKKWC